jgi:hypothetical protein
MVLTCEKSADGNSYDIITRTHGNIKDTVSRNSSTHMITIVKNNEKGTPIVAIKCYDGILKIIPLNSESKQLNVTTLRFETIICEIEIFHTN